MLGFYFPPKDVNDVNLWLNSFFIYIFLYIFYIVDQTFVLSYLLIFSQFFPPLESQNKVGHNVGNLISTFSFYVLGENLLLKATNVVQPLVFKIIDL